MTRITGKTTVDSRFPTVTAFSPTRYGRLLAETLPVHIADDEEYNRLEGTFQKLIKKGEDKLSPEEDRLFDLLADLLEQYEARDLPPLDPIAPDAALRFLIEQNDLKQADLEDIFGTQSAVSRAMWGKRRITIEQAKGLAKRFNVSAALFI